MYVYYLSNVFQQATDIYFGVGLAKDILNNGFNMSIVINMSFAFFIYKQLFKQCQVNSK